MRVDVMQAKTSAMEGAYDQSRLFHHTDEVQHLIQDKAHGINSSAGNTIPSTPVHRLDTSKDGHSTSNELLCFRTAPFGEKEPEGGSKYHWEYPMIWDLPTTRTSPPATPGSGSVGSRGAATPTQDSLAVEALGVKWLRQNGDMSADTTPEFAVFLQLFRTVGQQVDLAVDACLSLVGVAQVPLPLDQLATSPVVDVQQSVQFFDTEHAPATLTGKLRLRGRERAFGPAAFAVPNPYTRQSTLPWMPLNPTQCGNCGEEVHQAHLYALFLRQSHPSSEGRPKSTQPPVNNEVHIPRTRAISRGQSQQSHRSEPPSPLVTSKYIKQQPSRSRFDLRTPDSPNGSLVAETTHFPVGNAEQKAGGGVVLNGSAGRGIHGLQAANKKLLEEIESKNQAIQMMSEELENRTDAIRKCGTEIVSLRKQNREIRQVNQELERDKARHMDADKRMEQSWNEAAHSGKNVLPPQFLQQMNELNSKYEAAMAQNQEMHTLCRELTTKAQAFTRVQAAFQKLERAHVVQQKYIQKIQEENGKVSVFKSTVKTQEKVIQKLQTLVESKLKQRRRSNAEPPPSVKGELENLRKENDELRSKVNAGVASPEQTAELQHLRIQVSTVTSTMEDSAKRFAKQKSQYELRIMELEGQLMSNDDEFDFLEDDYGTDENFGEDEMSLAMAAPLDTLHEVESTATATPPPE
jgi:hypothetical protein